MTKSEHRFSSKRLASSLMATRVILLILFILPLGACVGAAVGAGAAVGVAAFDERGVEGVARDTSIATQIRSKLVGYDLQKNGHLTTDVSVEVHERRAMLTGIVKSEELRATAIRSAWEVEGVEKVINELLIGDRSLTDTALDSWIAAQFTSKITFDSEVKAVNYNAETVNGAIYLIGVAQNEAEHRRVLGHARSISRVRDVISHVRIKNAGQAVNKGGAKKGS